MRSGNRVIERKPAHPIPDTRADARVNACIHSARGKSVKSTLLSALIGGLLTTAPAFAVTIDFQDAGAYNFIQEYYNGGTNDAGASGPNLGVSFGPDALAVANDDVFTYYSNAPTPGVLAAVGTDAALNFADGFNDVSFWYSSIADTTVSIFAGLNGTGALLGVIDLFTNAQNGCSDTSFCHWDLASIHFDGLAQSIQFGDTAGLAGFDDVTVATVPEPSAAALMLTSLAGLVLLRRRQSA